MNLKIDVLDMKKDEVLKLSVQAFRNNNSLDLVQFLESIGVDVFLEEKEDDFNAHSYLDLNTNKVQILLNENHPLVRQRFSLAHELAHFILHKDKLQDGETLHRHNKTNLTKENIQQEKEADNLAAEILMPKEILEEKLIEIYKELPTTIHNNVIVMLSSFFKVSKLVAIQRLRVLGFYIPYVEL